MDTERINFLLNNPSDATKDDFLLLEEAVKNFPYAQVLHTLLAKIGKEIDSENKSRLLTTAAIYASDRSVLKEVIQNAEYLSSIDEVPVYQDLPIVELEPEVRDLNSDEQVEMASDSSTIFDEVLKNLQKLKALREQFLFLEEYDDTKESETYDEKVVLKVEPEAYIATESPKKPKKEEKKSIEKKKKKIDQLLKKDLELDTKVNEYFIAEIAQKKESAPVVITDKKTTQVEIIEKFIQEQPSIGSIRKELEKTADEITKDLSEKSTQFGDDLVSENLAIILLKQGKKDRALDIYRKLIWKLPQKKAYFAARIEEIKK